MGASGVVMFDLDGCLIDSTEPILQCLNAALAEHQLDLIERDQLWRHVGPPLQVTLAALAADAGGGPELVDSIIAAYRSRYTTMSIELAITYPGIADLVVALSATHRLAVVTSKPRRFALPILEHLGLASRFELVAGPEGSEAESKVETMEQALGLLGDVAPDTSVMIGDRHHDIEAAAHHGIAAIGVTWGFGSRVELTEAGARWIVDDTSGLAAALDIVVPATS